MSFTTTFSIRQLLLLILIFGWGFAALCVGGIVAQFFVVAIVGLSFAQGISALVATSRAKQAARGFVVPVIGYVLLMGLVGRSELTYSGIFPTTKLIGLTYTTLSKATATQPAASSPSTSSGGGGLGSGGGYGGGGYGGGGYGGGGYGGGGYGGGGYGGGGYGGGGYGGVGYGGGGYGGYGGGTRRVGAKSRIADQQTFFIVGHAITCLILGCLGTRYALWICPNTPPPPRAEREAP